MLETAKLRPAAVAIQISHRHHCVANGYAAHGAACGHDDAGQVEAEDDGGRPPKEVKLGELVLQRVERRGSEPDRPPAAGQEHAPPPVGARPGLWCSRCRGTSLGS